MFQINVIKQGIAWRIVEVVGTQFISFCSFLVLTRLLAPDHFGIVALASIFILISQLILSQGVGEALIQREDVEDSYYSSALWMNVISAAIVVFLLTLTSDVIAHAFSEPQFGPVLRATAPLLLLFAASGVLQAKLRRNLQLKAFAIATIVATTCGAVVAAIMAFHDYNVWSLVGQQWTFTIISTVLFWIFAAWTPNLFMSSDHVGKLFQFSVNTVGAAMLRFCLRQVDVLFMGFYLPSREVGLYFLATRILNTIGHLTYYSIQSLGLPILSRLQTDVERHHAAIISILRLTTLVCLPVFFGLAITADLIIPLVFGKEWTGSIQPFRILCLFTIFYALTLIASQVMLSVNQSSIVLRLTALNALVFAAAIAYAAPKGVAATALGAGLANMSVVPLYFLMLRRRLGVDLVQLGRDLIPIWTAAFVMTGGVMLARYSLLNSLPPLLALVSAILVGTVIFCLVIILLRRDYADELITIIAGRSSFGTKP